MNEEEKESESSLITKAEMAMKKAVAEVIEAHRRSGEPLAVWQNGRVVLLPPDQLGASESQPQRFNRKKQRR